MSSTHPLDVIWEWHREYGNVISNSRQFEIRIDKFLSRIGVNSGYFKAFKPSSRPFVESGRFTC